MHGNEIRRHFHGNNFFLVRPCPRFQGKLYGAFLAGEEKNPINFLSGLVSVKTKHKKKKKKKKKKKTNKKHHYTTAKREED